MLRNMKFGYVVHELWSKNMAINGGSTQHMKRLDHNSTKNKLFEVVVFFSSANLKKTM